MHIDLSSLRMKTETESTNRGRVYLWHEVIKFKKREIKTEYDDKTHL